MGEHAHNPSSNSGNVNNYECQSPWRIIKGSSSFKTEKISEAIEKVQQLQKEVKEFMADFRTSFDKSISDMNKVIEGFRSSLKAEKETLSTLHADIKLDNVDLNTTIMKQLTKLQNLLAAEK